MGLRLRLIFVLVIPLIFVLGVYGSIRVRREQEQRRDDNLSNVALAAKAIQIAVETALRDRNLSDIQDLLAELVEGKEDVDRIRLFDRALTPAVVSHRFPIGEEVPRAALQRVIDSGRAQAFYRESHGRLVLYYVAPIRDRRGATRAVMEVARLASTVQEGLRAAQREVWFRLSVLAVSVAALTGAMLQRQVLRPLSALMDGIQRLGQGPPGPALPVARGDEFGRVAAAFNEMADRLETARLKLIEETERTLDLERQLRQAETLAVAGKLATAFAHEVGTPLNIISGRAEYLLQDLPLDDPHRADLEGIVDQIDRISGIIRSLLDAVRPQKPDLEAVRLGDVVERLLPLMEHAAKRHGVRLAADVRSALPAILADPRQLQQILINLLVNAIEAAAPEGAVQLSAQVEQRGGRAGIAIAVTDTGPGIPHEYRTAVFKPFFTTKPRGRGTGLGLSICRDIVREHHGDIGIESPENGGTTFSVWLPNVMGAAG